MNYVLTLDVGTTNVKAVLIDEYGNVVTYASIRNELNLGSDGSAEHDLRSLYSKCIEASKAVVKGFENSIVAVSLSTYLHGLAVLGRGGEVLNNVMTHLDLRAAGYELPSNLDGYELYVRTGCPPAFVYPMAKIRWFTTSRRELTKDVSRYSLVKDYIIEKFIGEPFVDYGVASGSQLLNIHELKWDDLVLRILGLDEAKLPELIEGCKILEFIRPSLLRELGITNDKVALVAGTFDGGAQNVGLGALEDNVATVNLGSTAVLRVLTDSIVVDRSREMRFFSYYVADGIRACGGASNNGCTALDWLLQLLNLSYRDVDSVTEDIKPGADGLYFMPFLAGERFPFRDPYLRGSLIGLRLSHGKGHVVRALLEGVAFNLRIIKNALEENGVRFKAVICGGGGCKSRVWRNIVESVLCLPIVSSSYEEHAANRGVGLLALKALSIVKDLRLFKFTLSDSEVVGPDGSACRVFDEIFNYYLELFNALRRFFRERVR